MSDAVPCVSALSIGCAVVGADDDQCRGARAHGVKERLEAPVDVAQRRGVCLEAVTGCAGEVMVVGLVNGRDVDEEKEPAA